MNICLNVIVNKVLYFDQVARWESLGGASEFSVLEGQSVLVCSYSAHTTQNLDHVPKSFSIKISLNYSFVSSLFEEVQKISCDLVIVKNIQEWFLQRGEAFWLITDELSSVWNVGLKRASVSSKLEYLNKL